MNLLQKIKDLVSPYSPQSTKQWIVASCAAATVSTAVLITVLCVRAKRLSKEQRKPLPSNDKLAILGGKYFVRPSDGKRMEYFTLNEGEGRNAIVICHGSSGTGYCWAHWRVDRIKPLLQKHNVQLICPSMPGHGASEPQRISDPKKILDNYANDMIALLNKLKVGEMSTGGISYGAEPSFYLAEKLLKSTLNIKVNTVASICGVPWSTLSFSMADATDRGLFVNALSKLFATPTLLEFMAVYVMGPMLSGDHIVESMAPKEVADALKAMDVTDALDTDLKRGFEYFWDGAAIAATFNSCTQMHDVNTDYAWLNDQDIKVNFHYGTRDTDASPKLREFIMNRIPKGTLYEYEGVHLQVPLLTAIQKMLE